MRMKWPFAVSLGVVVFGMAAPARGIPAFARRYEVACHFCHEGFPKLNLMGQRFKERGFRLEKEEAFDFDKWMRRVPIGLRVTGTQLLIEDADDGTFGFFKPIAAGNLGSRFSFWVDWGLIVRSDSLTPSGEDNTEFQDVSNAWARLDLARDGRFYVRGGRIELDLPFTQIRTPNLLSYEIYNANTGFESDNIASFQDGGEIGGDLGESGSFHWSAAVVGGHDADSVDDLDAEEAEKFEANVFLRLAVRSGRSRFGTFAYLGRNHLARAGVSLDPDWENDIVRVGVDASVWAQRLNVYGVGMYGRNSNAIATPQEPEGTGESQHFSGGFLQADFHARDDFALTARLNVVNRPDGLLGENTTFTTFVPGVRFFLFDRFRLAFEYAFANKDRASVGAVQADIAF
jgi:hypothetical protein